MLEKCLGILHELGSILYYQTPGGFHRQDIIVVLLRNLVDENQIYFFVISLLKTKLVLRKH